MTISDVVGPPPAAAATSLALVSPALCSSLPPLPPPPAATKNHSNSTVLAVPNVQCDAFAGRMEEHHPAGTARSRLSLSTRHC